jgi:hypothetical protein
MMVLSLIVRSVLIVFLTCAGIYITMTFINNPKVDGFVLFLVVGSILGFVGTLINSMNTTIEDNINVSKSRKRNNDADL